MPLLIAAFILSGAAGLIYESIWSRYLGLFVGHSAYAQIIVLVIFLGGMSLGAWLVGERSARIRRPLRAYALVELLAGLLGFAFHGIFLGASGLAYDTLFPSLAGGPGLLVAKWTLAGLLILPQSILLGTTFPLMTAGAIRLARRTPGRTLAMMYFANSLGAAIGVLLAGFVLLEWGGLPGTLEAAGVINIIVAAAVFLGGKYLGWDDATAETPDAAAPDEPAAGMATPADVAAAHVAVPVARPTAPIANEAAPSSLQRLLLLVAFGTAVASFVYEIAWIRMLSLVLGSATHSFELMLSAFILGLAIGAFVVRRYADRFQHPVRQLGIVQWVMGTLAIATLPVYLATFGWMSGIQNAVALTDGGYSVYAVARYLLCVLVMFPATICAGMTLPLITRTLYAQGAGERAIGRVYSINTLGSILGVVLAGLVLMPILGLKWLLITGALIDIALGAVLVLTSARRTPLRNPRLASTLAVATGVFIIAVAATADFDQSVLSSGVFRRGLVAPPGSSRIHFYKDGRTATVTVKQARDGGVLTLSTNGKPDASVAPMWLSPDTVPAAPVALAGDMSTQILLALNTIAHVPNARTGAVIGQGSGVTSHFLLASPTLEHLATIEIEPEMIEASRRFRPFNRRVFDDPRSHFVVDDAKSYFAAGQRKYDLILSEPSNPWVSGVSGLFTDEFYRRVRTHLTDDGVFGQWLHLYEIDDVLVSSVLAAIDRNFDDYAVYFTAGIDILVVAKPRGRLPRPDWNAVVAWPMLREDLKRAVPLTPEALDRTRVVTRDVLHPMLAVDAEPNSDFAPVLDLGTERTRFLQHRADGLLSLSRRRFDLARALTGDTAGFGTATDAVTGAITMVAGLSNGALLRAARAGTLREIPPDSPLSRMRQRQAALTAVLQSPQPPADWRAWLDMVTEAEADLHTGTAGVADEIFWQPVLTYAERHDAPPGARSALEVLYGSAKWDWPRVARAAQAIAAQKQQARWVNPDLLRDAIVTAYLRLGQPAEARRSLSTFTDPARRGDSTYEFRTRLLFWYTANALGQLEPRPGDGPDAPANRPVNGGEAGR